ncbi:UDP-glucuronate 5'-epimerase [Roseibium sp. TrichSKD4]|uniref:NAD-dependent epimerase/dehydratase family protein n=1 Tax=Roseibium sp. TrichSKD4 TaxID=744980 RepID=UPI0001E56593|nr:NAD-dependent epimerase/dehydratase family protein [Roseibium sp. TrichSKD4]EFO34000.1 UDP-glucuronate 5'-epimerase [Roseibium sp. TrichSKD4]
MNQISTDGGGAAQLTSRKILITGVAGFIGFHLARHMLNAGWVVAGIDGLTDYYDVNLKRKRLSILHGAGGSGSNNFQFHHNMLEDADKVQQVFEDFRPDVVVHLAAQAGVRYSLENPRAYIDANLVGTFNVMEGVRELKPQHFLAASTSSVYGANTVMPFTENQRTDHVLTLYAATKKANESMLHSYAHLWKLPTTVFRFFTVYGPWGRPDMALFKFVKATLADEPIDVYGEGNMQRDFTYIDDLVESIARLVDAVPQAGQPVGNVEDSLSPVAPYRVVNIGGGRPVGLMEFIEHMETELGKPAIRNMMPMQKGDVRETVASAELLEALTGYCPRTDVATGVRSFVKWYRDFYQV